MYLPASKSLVGSIIKGPLARVVHNVDPESNERILLNVSSIQRRVKEDWLADERRVSTDAY
jgi:hypothetical protein